LCAASGQERGQGYARKRRMEELESLDIRVQGVTQLRSGHRDRDPTKDRPPTPHFIVSIARGPEVSGVRSITELCGLRVSVESYVAPKGPLQCKRCQRFGHTQRNCGYAPRCVECEGSHLSGGCTNPREQSLCCGCGGNHTASYRGCVKWKEAKSALAKQTLERGRRTVTTAHPPAPQQQRAGSSAEQMYLGEWWNHVVQGGRVVKATTPNPTPKQPSQSVTEAPERHKVTATSKMARHQKSGPKTPAAPKPATGKLKKTVVPSAKPAAAKPKNPSLVAPKPTPPPPSGTLFPSALPSPPTNVWS
jgi:hypothetical protein